MRLGRVEFGKAARWARFSGDGLVQLFPAGCGFDDLVDFSVGQGSCQPEPDRLPLDAVKILAPVAAPEKLLCVGKNYADHAREMGGEVPELPVIFSKFSSAMIGPDSPIHHPAISEQVDFEAELVVVIGRAGRDIPRESALQHVAGYTCGNDVSARDWQKGRPGGQWLLGKTFDTFAPVGPWWVTPDEIGDPHSLEITFRLNGKVMQQATTDLLIYPIDYLIHHLSRFVTLRPGDLIFTGTPAGVGAGRTPPVWLKPGDLCEVSINRIGTLRNPVVGA